MVSNISERRGRVTRVTDKHIYISLIGYGSDHDCGACALASACSGHGSDCTETEIFAARPQRHKMQPTVGSSVTVELMPGSAIRATSLLLVLPLMVLLVAAFICSAADMRAEYSGLISLTAMAAYFGALYIANRHCKPAWRITAVGQSKQ